MSDNPEELVGNYSDIERAAFAYAVDLRRHYKDYMLDYFHDDSITQAFRDEQLKLWLEARTYFQHMLIRRDALYRNDWNQNGLPHLLPDGTPGPDHDHPFDPNPDDDPFMPGYYNTSATTHDVRSGEYFGFQPKEGDKVGKLGDRDGNGSIADYLDDDVDPGDLVGRHITVIWYDWMEGESEEFGAYSNEPSQELIDELKTFFREDSPHPIDCYLLHRGGPLEHDPETTYREARQYYIEHVPEPLKGPVNYALYTHQLDPGTTADPDLEAAGLELDLYPSNGAGMMAYSPDYGPETFAKITLHEVYGHGVGDLRHNPDGGTLMTVGDASLTFAHEEWESILHNMDVENGNYFANTLLPF